MENHEPLQPRPEKRYKEAIPVDINKVREAMPKPASPAVVSGKEVDDVLLSALVYKNPYVKKSLSVHHLQRRLNELGYVTAHLDKDGWFGDGTRLAVEEFRSARSIVGSGVIDADTLKAIFDGDPAVKLIV